jgi:retron-type reverse transcriptase
MDISHHRSVVANVDGVEATRNAETGCPQGGVLSPLLWNLVMEEILDKLRVNFPQLYSQEFADDLACLADGVDPSTVRSHAQ